MPVETQPDRGALWLRNRLLESTIAVVSNQHVNYPATRLLNPFRSDPWQSTVVGVDTYVVYDCGAPVTPAGFALIGSNLDKGAYIRLRGSDDSAQAVNSVYWDLPLYTQDAYGQVLKWYPSTPTSGSIGLSTNPADAASARGRQFWSYRILPGTFGSYNTVEDYYQVGVAFLASEYLAIRPWEGIRISPKNPSTRVFSYGRAKWSDPQTPYRSVDVPLGGLSMADFYTIEAAARAQGEAFALLDVHAFSTDAILKRGGCVYGYFDGDPIDGSIDSPEDNKLRLQFEEASG